MGHDDELLSVGEIAERADLRVSHVRYYERAGLLPPPRLAGRRRLYPVGVLARLRIIADAQEAGLSLAEIGELSALPGLRIDGPRGEASRRSSQR
jgi:MerR family redox-sensitive transcriptional activator SoxR